MYRGQKLYSKAAKATWAFSILAIAAFHCLILAPTASARTVFPIYGANGDKGATDECPAGQYFVGVVGNVGAWVDQITVYCAPKNPDGSIGGAKSIASRGGSGGAYSKEMCGKDEVITRINVSRTGDYQTRGLDFTCKNVKTNATHVLYFGGNSRTDGDPRNMACGATEAATGMVIRWGKYVNGLGLICNVMPAAAKPASPPLSLGAQIVKFATDALGKCVDAAEKVRNAPCDPLPMGTVGDGECTHLVQAALDSVHARNDPGKYDWGTKVSQSPYSSSANIQPGDIIQFFNNAELDDPQGKNVGWWATTSQHTAIVEKNSGGVLSVLEQNTWVNNDTTDRRYVTRGTINLNWNLVSGNFIIYRAEKLPGFARLSRTAVRSSGHRSIRVGH